MSYALNQILCERQRDAMLAFYLAWVMPGKPSTDALTPQASLSTADDLYAYWLLDPQVSMAVPTTRIASAIASVQQYIHSLLQGLEPGYETQGPSDSNSANWRDRLQTYSLWRAHQQLHHDPVSYLDPGLRRGKSDSFKQLENDLNQNQIQPDTVLNAVQSYLNRFEVLANLKTLNGYIDGNKDNLVNSVYYFIGKSSAENTYYWRSLDMRSHPMSQGTEQRRPPYPTAWTDWGKIPLSMSEDVPEHTIRPVMFNGRLYVIWAQCIRPVTSFADTVAFETRGDDESTQVYRQRLEARLKSHYLQLRLNFTYKKFDGSWSVPQACIQEYCVMKPLYDLNHEELKSATRTIATLDSHTTPPSLLLSLSAEVSNYTPSARDESAALFLEAVRLDQHLTITTLFSKGGPWNNQYDEADVKLAERCRSLFNQHNLSNFQFMVPQTEQHQVSNIAHLAPHPGTAHWDFDGAQGNIRDFSPQTDVLFNVTTSRLEVSTTLSKGFPHHRTVVFENTHSPIKLKLTLSTDGSSSEGSANLRLSKRSSLEIQAPFELTSPENLVKFRMLCNSTGITYEDFILRTGNNPFLPWPTHPMTARANGPMVLDLEGAHIDPEAFDDYFNTRECIYTFTLKIYDPTCTRYINELIISNLQTTQLQRMYRPVILFPLHANNPTPASPYRANTVLVGMAERSRRTLHGSERTLAEGSVHRAQIELNPLTLRPLGEVENGSVTNLTLIYGVLTLEADELEREVSILGYALKASTFTLDLTQNKTVIPLSPGIRHYAATDQGTAEFIDFSAVATTDTLPSIRTNTAIAYLLAKHANVSLDEMFSLPLSTWREPPLVAGQQGSGLDFRGAHGKYCWELFVYLPWLLAHRLNQDQLHEQAHTWIRYLFDPLRKADPTNSQPAYWRVPELQPEKPELSYAVASPDDPHQLALSEPRYLRQALYLLYVDILLNCGDTAYRYMTRDGLNEAKLWYVRSQNLLGPRPPVNPVEPWSRMTLEQLTRTTSTTLREWEQQADQTLLVHSPTQAALGARIHQAHTLDSQYLCRTLSPGLLARWDKIEVRLHNLRHHLDLTGKPLSIPLYAAALTPHALVTAYAQGAASGGARSLLRQAQVGHYRFQVVLGHALRAVDNLTQLGSTLLTLFERKEQAHFLEAQQLQAWNLAAIAIEQQTQALHTDIKSKQALLAGRHLVEARQRFYETQLRQGISAGETQAGLHFQDAVKWDAAASAAQGGGGLAMLLPNIFGTSNGGIRYEGAFVALQAAAQGIANEKRANAQHLDRSEQFSRRAQEWSHALEQSRLELAQVDAQLAAFSQQQEHTRLQLHLAQTTLEQTRNLYDVLGKRFAKEQLYDWLKNQLASLYYQAYDVTLSLCLNAEACWRYERAQWQKTFIHASPWSTQYRGLGAGESLKANLLAMDSAYLDQDERNLEITKTVSLRHLHDKDPLATFGLPWTTLKTSLVTSGTLRFELTRKLFDHDYPNHYLRRIKSVSVSLPTTLGPYEDVKAILTQTAHSTWLAPDNADEAANVFKDLRIRQEVALSSGLNDSGLFTLSFENDERYLPFEYTGAVSAWQLTFPNPAQQRTLLESMTDIIVHLRYTAKSSGGQS